MKLNVDTTLTDFSGKPLPSNDRLPTSPPKPGQAPSDVVADPKPLLLAEVLISVLMMPAEPSKPYTADQQTKRYLLAMTIHKAKTEAPYEVDITAEEAAFLKLDLAKAYAPIVAGQVIPMLDGK